MKIGDTFKHWSLKGPGFFPKCYVRGFVDGFVIIRWYGGYKDRSHWWHYEMVNVEMFAKMKVEFK